MANIVKGEMYEEIDGQLHEIKRQLRQKSGYPYDTEELKKALQAIVEGKFWSKSKYLFPTWRIIKLGTGLKTADDFRQALKQGGCKITNWGIDMLDRPDFTVANRETEVKLVKATNKELTGKDRAPYREICQCAKEHDWKKCPTEVGPQLRLQYPDQPYGEGLIIITEPITDSSGTPKLFRVARNDCGLWLSSFCDLAYDALIENHQLVFCE